MLLKLIKRNRGISLWKEVIKKNNHLSKQLNKFKNQMWKGGTPNFSNILNQKTKEKLKAPKILKKKKNPWIIKYLKAPLPEIKEERSQDKTSRIITIKTMLTKPNLKIKTEKYKSKFKINLIYTAKKHKGIILCPLPHSS